MCDSRSIGPIGLWLDMWGSNPCQIIPYAIIPHERFEPLTQDSMSNPLTNCTILGPYEKYGEVDRRDATIIHSVAAAAATTVVLPCRRLSPGGNALWSNAPSQPHRPSPLSAPLPPHRHHSCHGSLIPHTALDADRVNRHRRVGVRAGRSSDRHQLWLWRGDDDNGVKSRSRAPQEMEPPKRRQRLG